MLDDVQYTILKTLFARGPDLSSGDYAGMPKAERALGKALLQRLVGKTVIDFGCGEGDIDVEIAKFGAEKVIGIDYRESVLEIARKRAEDASVGHLCEFATASSTLADTIVSIDAFEHFDDPGEILRSMDGLLKPDGEIVISFGPTWLHPLGGHSFSMFPWGHLLFSEKALIRWRTDFRPDGATRFSEIGGGLNQITIGRFERIVAESPFRFAEFEAVPIRVARRLHNSLTREFLTSSVRCRLVRRDRS